ncbi:hypothetical protein GCM10023185_19890 [Hymenobacter saemangeumensis]|uniref:DUF481 domain-containing protein n=1 Tax=Hymenobacter saemangeumensis TaxID=1084522 RepID=A0ABP8ID66_9BACT
MQLPSRWLPGCALLLGLCLSARAQTAAPDTAATPARRGSFTASLSAGNNSSFFGRTQARRYPYAAAELSYKTASGFWGSALSYNLFDTTSFIDETDLSLGWDGDLSKRVDASLSYSRFVFADNSPLVKSSVRNSLDGYLGLDWGYVYSRLNAAYVFGDSGDFFLILDNSRNFEWERVLQPSAYLSLEPRVSVTAGTQRFAQTSLVQQQQRGNGPVRPPRGPGRTTTVVTELSRFAVLSYELRVPLTYSLGAWSAQVAWRYNVPVNLLPDDVSEARSFVTASLSLTL